MSLFLLKLENCQELLINWTYNAHPIQYLGIQPETKFASHPLHLESNELIDECSYSFRVALPSIAQSSRYINGEIIGMNIVTTTGYALLI